MKLKKRDAKFFVLGVTIWFFIFFLPVPLAVATGVIPTATQTPKPTPATPYPTYGPIISAALTERASYTPVPTQTEFIYPPPYPAGRGGCQGANCPPKRKTPTFTPTASPTVRPSQTPSSTPTVRPSRTPTPGVCWPPTPIGFPTSAPGGVEPTPCIEPARLDLPILRKDTVWLFCYYYFGDWCDPLMFLEE